MGLYEVLTAADACRCPWPARVSTVTCPGTVPGGRIWCRLPRRDCRATLIQNSPDSLRLALHARRTAPGRSCRSPVRVARLAAPGNAGTAAPLPGSTISGVAIFTPYPNPDPAGCGRARIRRPILQPYGNRQGRPRCSHPGSVSGAQFYSPTEAPLTLGIIYFGRHNHM